MVSHLRINQRKIAFTDFSLVKFKSGDTKFRLWVYNRNPKESIKFDYYYNDDLKIYILFVVKRDDCSTLGFRKLEIPSNINKFKYGLKVRYARVNCLRKLSFADHLEIF